MKHKVQNEHAVRAPILQSPSTHVLFVLSFLDCHPPLVCPCTCFTDQASFNSGVPSAKGNSILWSSHIVGIVIKN
jgi:hypothetical protein